MTIPVLDVSDFLAGKAGQIDQLATQLRSALENVGFYYLTGHDIPDELIQRVFANCARFHELPLATKNALAVNEHIVGYMPINGYVSKRLYPELAKG